MNQVIEANQSGFLCKPKQLAAKLGDLRCVGQLERISMRMLSPIFSQKKSISASFRYGVGVAQSYSLIPSWTLFSMFVYYETESCFDITNMYLWFL